ncbi:PIN domain-like protein [Lentinula lateritia]|nr:PIN domain-like protein [Lentinula lateritia]
MGIKDLWSLVDDAAFTCKLRDFVLEHGFIKDHYGSCTVVIGIDISSFLDGYHASSRAKGKLHISNSTLTQFYKMLCSLSKSGAHCIFVYDGDEQPSVKQGKQVVMRELDYQKHSRTMIKHFGYYCHTAPGEAEAELVDLYKQGIIDTVLSKNSNVFPLGATSVMKVIVPKGPGNSWRKDLRVCVYRSETMGYSQGGFILIALLLRNDLTSSVNGIGHQTACGLAHSGFGDDLLSTYQLFSEDLQQLSQAFQKLNEDMVYEIEHNKRDKMGSRSPIRAGIFRDSKFPIVADIPALDAFLRPATSSSRGLSLAQSSLRLPTLPDIPGITKFCTTYFAWSEKLTLEHLHTYLWSGVVM